MSKNLFSPNKPGSKSFDDHVKGIYGVLRDNGTTLLSAGVEDLYSDDPNKRAAAQTAVAADMQQFDATCGTIDEQVEALIADTEAELGVIAQGDGTTTGAGTESVRRRVTPAIQQAIRQLVHSARTAEDAAAYHRKSSTWSPGAGIDGKEQSAFDFAAGLEAFDNTDYRNTVARSIAYAASTVGQGAVAEANFKTEILTPDQGNYQFRVLIPTVHNEHVRNDNAAPYDLKQRRLVDATRYKDILKDDLTEVVPAFIVGREARFAPTTDITPWPANRDGFAFTTSALRMGADIDLVATNSLEELPNRGNSNSSDSLDRGVAVDSIFVKVTNQANNASSIFRLSTIGKSGYHFQPGQEDVLTKVFLNFNNLLYISKDTPTIDGAPAAVLNPVLALNQNAVIAVRVKLSGEVDHETGNASVSATQSVYNSVYERNENGHRRTTITDTPTVNATVAAFNKVEVIGWLPKARVSNLNRRDQGHLMRVQTRLTSVPVYLNSPFTARTPAGGNHDADKAELRKLAFVAARVSNDLAAHTEIWSAVDVLRQWKGMGNETTDFNWARLGFVADDYIEPFFDEITVDLLRDTQSNTASNKLSDITSTLALNITDLALTAIRESNINSALDLLGAPDYKVDIIASCDPYVEAYLRLIGDSRTAGTAYKVVPVSTVDERWRDKITLTLRVTLEGDASILNFGKHLNMPRYVTDLVVPRDGAVANEVSVQTRRKYFVTCPIMGVINVKNLSKAVRNLLKFQTQI